MLNVLTEATKKSDARSAAVWGAMVVELNTLAQRGKKKMHILSVRKCGDEFCK